GGSVRAHSDGPGQGSEFVVRLPLLAERWSAGSGPGVNGRLIESSARRILVVADNGDAADSLGGLPRLRGERGGTAPQRPARLGGGGGGRGVRAGRGAAGPRPAEDERLRSLPPPAGRAFCQRPPGGCPDRLRPGRGPPPHEGGRFRPPSGQAGEP